MTESTQRQSRVLAALGGKPLISKVPQSSETPLNVLKRKGTPNIDESLAELSAKKRAGPSQLGVGHRPVQIEGK